jgi:diguanylate cyclase (GGDEF)-like protein
MTSGSDPAEAAGRPDASGARFAPVLIAVCALGCVSVWLVWRGPDDVVLGNLGGSVVLLTATAACYRVSRGSRAPSPVRGFWLLWSYSAATLFVSTIAAMAAAVRRETGMPLYEAVPTMLSLTLAMLAFRHVPLNQRSKIDWVRLVLDGAAVAVSGAVFFGYVLLHAAHAGVPLVVRATAAAVGVGCLLALVVFGKAAVSPRGRVDTGALTILAVTPVVGLAAVIVFLQGTPLGMMLLSVLGFPLVGLVMCAGALRQSLVDSGAARQWERGRRRSLADPLQYLAVTVVAALVITVSARDLDARGQAVIVGAVLIATILVARQLLTVRENAEALAGIRRQQAELQRLALSDSLTGLPSRTAFGVALTERLDAGHPATVLMIDVDDFKMINDTLGPAAADQLLHQIGQRLRDICGSGEVAARLGGDEFALLLPHHDAADAERTAAHAQQAVSEPVQAAQHQLMLHASIGVAAAAPGESADEVLRNADIAMYAAKEAGKAAWVRYDPQMRHDMTAHARTAGELRDAITRGELRLLYQPVFDLRTERLHGAEALVRWHHPVHGLVSPAEFIPVAERSGLIVPLGAWVLHEACTTLARWHAEHPCGAAIEAINVNVAVRQLREPDFAAGVAAVLAETGLAPRNLVLEVTESAVVDGPQVNQTLQQLHDLGVQLALDDFGTGQSSLSLLRTFPANVIKLDKSFVDGIAAGADRGRQAIAMAVAQLADNLGLKAVAEGIETRDQLNRLRQMGFPYGQGFLLAKPMPADECAALMAASTPVPTA